MYEAGMTQADSQAYLSADSGLGSGLVQMLMAPEIVPGSEPSYQLCKTIYSYHPLGAILADAPITRAMAQTRNISVATLAEDHLVDQFRRTWNGLAKIGGTAILHDLLSTSRIYGIASMAVGEVGKDPSTPLDMATIADADLYVNILDPLNTAGSLVLNQDPNAPDFLKPKGAVHVYGQAWHPSRLIVKMNEQPLYIDWSASAFGFVGRSIYQRALYPLKSFIQSMVTDQLVVQKAGLLVYKSESPSSIIDSIMQRFMGAKRAAIKAGVTNQVLSIGVLESIETLNMMNLDKAFSAARTNIIKNIASAAGMPASIIAQETLTEGFGEGTEDMKKEVQYLDYLRADMDPAFQFLDAICRRKAWTPSFYESLRTYYPSEFGEGGFDSALHEWIRLFAAKWPNLLVEPDSEKVLTEDVQMKSVIALLEVVLPQADPKTKAKLIAWAAENVNTRERIFAGSLDVDEDDLRDYFEEHASQASPPESSEGPPRIRAFGANT